MKYTKLLLIVGVGALGWFAYINLRGARPAFGPPAGDIVTEMQKSSKNTTGLPLALPSGFSISIFAKDLASPRVLAFDPAGTLLVSIPSRGQVVTLADDNSDGVADRAEVILDHLNRPHGIAFHPKEKSLFVAEMDGVFVYDYDSVTRQATNRTKRIDLPGGGNHTSRTIAFNKDGRLYISVGSSCNVCIEDDARRAAILVADVTGPGPVTSKVFASGLRNSVFFTWHPVTKELWATEMGRDLIGDDIPPDEINIVRENSFYGWPYCYGKNIRDETFFDLKGLNMSGFQGLTLSDVCGKATPSYIDLPAHSAPLGLAFIPAQGIISVAAATKNLPSTLWPEEYQGDLLVAFHGSWNRSDPTGYKVVRMKLDEQGNYLGTEDFITGWLAGNGVLGRPVDLVFDTKGTLYISDDKAGTVYRVSPTTQAP